MKFIFTLFILFTLACKGAVAQDQKVPRFVSIRSEKANARVGPGLRYPVEWVFVRHRLPVKVIREFGHWRLVRDDEGAEGWIHLRMLSGLRTVRVLGNDLTYLYGRPSERSTPVAKLEPGVICQLLTLEKEWVKVKIQDEKGWLKRDQIWGILPDEG